MEKGPGLKPLLEGHYFVGLKPHASTGKAMAEVKCGTDATKDIYRACVSKWKEIDG
jgi:hypothetical protein